MIKKIYTTFLLLNLFLSFASAQSFTEYEQTDLPSAQYTPMISNENNQDEIGKNYLEENYSPTTSLNNIEKYCPYQFKKTLKEGDRNYEVKILQAVLNSDSRTIVASTGPGSPGNETTLFGPATKDAVKRFQAFFITPELGQYAIPVANGTFGPKTRMFLNALCNNEKFYKGGVKASSIIGGPVSNINNINNQQPVYYNNISTNNTNISRNDTVNTTQNTCDKRPFTVTLQANTRTVKCDAELNACEPFKVNLYTSESLATIGKDAIAIDGDGAVGDIRKLSKTSFQIMIIPTGKSKTIDIQIPADKLTSSCGKQNENASNQVFVLIGQQTNNNLAGTNTIASSSSTLIDDLNKQLNQKLAELSQVASSSNNAEFQKLKEEKDKLQREIDELKKNQNNQNCYQGVYGTYCQSPQQRENQRRAEQNDALMRALQALNEQNNNRNPYNQIPDQVFPGLYNYYQHPEKENNKGGQITSILEDYFYKIEGEKEFTKNNKDIVEFYFVNKDSDNEDTQKKEILLIKNIDQKNKPKIVNGAYFIDKEIKTVDKKIEYCKQPKDGKCHDDSKQQKTKYYIPSSKIEFTEYNNATPNSKPNSTPKNTYSKTIDV